MRSEIMRSDWTGHYHGFDGHGAIAADNAPLRILQDATRMRWPTQPRPDLVARLRIEKAQPTRSMHLVALPTLYPAYLEAALLAVLGVPRAETQVTAYQAAFSYLMMAKEGCLQFEAAGTPRSTRHAGSNWTLGQLTLWRYGKTLGPQISQALLRVTSLAFPPAEPRFWMHRYVFDSDRKANFTLNDKSRSGVIGVYNATFADTLLVGEVLPEGGPKAGYLVLHKHLQARRDAWQGSLNRLGVEGQLYWDALQDGPGTRRLTHWSLDQPLRTQAAELEITHRFVAHNLIELIRLTFERRKLPDFEGAVRAIKGAAA